ncbi:galactinol--sucrose galactosyltransferase 2 [Pyrus ussuriensis x Pyrus communis]|uniref:Galactinol--sucrose galactosyltransferase 2 n=1 Tax=Pyrus ussuriensis x Pyrus communis TaxID=2448454 RepID=A0A5N5GPC6_9ROSA|nr:galactinol--sucrose galactosyltransferase 2 [Pyrus ussuriensis x Pyrus communis]
MMVTPQIWINDGNLVVPGRTSLIGVPDNIVLRGVEEAAVGVKNGEGELVGAVAVDELAELHHGDDVTHSCSYVQHYYVYHGGCYCSFVWVWCCVFS